MIDLDRSLPGGSGRRPTDQQVTERTTGPWERWIILLTHQDWNQGANCKSNLIWLTKTGQKRGLSFQVRDFPLRRTERFSGPDVQLQLMPLCQAFRRGHSQTPCCVWVGLTQSFWSLPLSRLFTLLAFSMTSDPLSHSHFTDKWPDFLTSSLIFHRHTFITMRCISVMAY